MRLEASIKAVELGQDEVKAFRDGLKKPEDIGNNQIVYDESKEDMFKKTTYRGTNRLTYRNTQRNKNKNMLEMEVEKDLTALKNILMKKKESKK